MKTCANCHREFKNTKHSTQKYCSRLCYDAKRYAQVRRVCLECGRRFSFYKSKGDSKYCSRSCYLNSPQSQELRSRQKPKGSDHWNWKGGIIKGRPDRNLGVYKQWRKAVFERDDYTCQMCDKRGGWLEADHIKGWADYPDLRYDVTNGRTLCLNCHRKRTSEQFKGRLSHATI